MRLRSVAIALLVLAMAAVCVRLGFWQLARLDQKRALNAGLRSTLSLPAMPIANAHAFTDSLRGRRVMLHGVFDERRQVLLSGRVHAGSPGVHVVTPLRLEGDSVAVLVDRGWLPSQDAAAARPQDDPEPGLREVVGIADSMPRGIKGPPLRTIEADSITLLSTQRLDLDSLSRRMPYALAPFIVRELPSPGLPTRPLREAPRPFDESMHLGYAIQWFSFATIILVGSSVLAWSRRRGASSGPAGPTGPA